MSCPELRDRLPAYLDDELDAIPRAGFEEHLRGCGECSREMEALHALRAGLRDDAFRRTASAGLKERIRSSLRPIVAPRLARRAIPTWLASAAALLIGVGVGAGGMYLAVPKTAESGAELPRSLVDAHVRSLMEQHLYDVESTDRHTVKPWFEGRVDFSMPVKDFREAGFPLEGGRVDEVGGRRVAALVYGRAKHHINLFIWPAIGESDSDVLTTTGRGYMLLHWTRDGLTFWATSDVNADDLKEFVRLQRQGGT